MFEVERDIVFRRRFEGGAARLTEQLPGEQMVLQLAHRTLAPHVVFLQPLHRRHHLRRNPKHLGKQQVGLLGMMKALRKLVDVKQHGAQDVKKPVRLVARSAPKHQAQRAQHRSQGGVLVADSAQA